jgi:hypothetical protein
MRCGSSGRRIRVPFVCSLQIQSKPRTEPPSRLFHAIAAGGGSLRPIKGEMNFPGRALHCRELVKPNEAHAPTPGR